MSRVVVLGAGISGHTAAAFLRKWMDKRDEVIVISPSPEYNWIPSNIWVGVGLLRKQQVTFPIAPVYGAKHIAFKQGRAVALYPQGDENDGTPAVEFEHVNGGEEAAARAYHVRLSGERNGAEVEFCCDARAGSRREQLVGLYGGPCRGNGGGVQANRSST